MDKFKKHSTPYMFILPAILLLFVFSILPIIISLVISFTNMDIKGLADWSQIDFVGFKNFIQLFQDKVFLKSMLNTGIYVVIGVPLQRKYRCLASTLKILYLEKAE